MDALADLDDGGLPAAGSCLGYRLGLAFALRCGSPTGCSARRWCSALTARRRLLASCRARAEVLPDAAAGGGSRGGRNGLVDTGGLGQSMLPPVLVLCPGLFMVAGRVEAGKVRGTDSGSPPAEEALRPPPSGIPRAGCTTRRHARVGGEDPSPWGPSAGRNGTPPRRRGGRVRTGPEELHGRNTPASAGRTRSSVMSVSGGAEHPRVGGEDRNSGPLWQSLGGTPPRRRGGPGPEQRPNLLVRNTPASAGRTPSRFR